MTSADTVQTPEAPQAAEAAQAAPAVASTDKPARAARAPAGRKPPHPVLEQLFALYPQLFGARFVPLKLGVYDDLLARHPGTLDKAQLKVALGLHARSMRYLEAVASGLPRHDLDGQPVGPVAPEHVHHAIGEVWKRRALREPKQDFREGHVAMLVRAIDDSGLDREAYAERVKPRDDAAQGLLDEAFAAIGVLRAKREALRRAFEASGKPVAEFAADYGLSQREAKRALG